jgi:hypothetical protein
MSKVHRWGAMLAFSACSRSPDDPARGDGAGTRPEHTKGAVDHGALREFFGCTSRSELQKPEGRVPASATAVSRGDSAKRGQPPS